MASVVSPSHFNEKRGGARQEFGLSTSGILATFLTFKKASFFLSVKWE